MGLRRFQGLFILVGAGLAVAARLRSIPWLYYPAMLLLIVGVAMHFESKHS